MQKIFVSVKNWLAFNWLPVLAIAFLTGAFAGITVYAYFQAMNWVVMGAALMTASNAKKLNIRWAMWFFVALAILFNPIAAIYLSAEQWLMADRLAIAVFLVSFFIIRKK
jgi:hypothetical protein